MKGAHRERGLVTKRVGALYMYTLHLPCTDCIVAFNDISSASLFATLHKRESVVHTARYFNH